MLSVMAVIASGTPPEFVIWTVNVSFDVIIFLTLGLMFGGMAVLMATLPPWLASGAPWGVLLCVGLIVFGLLLVPLALLRRLNDAMHSRRLK